MFGWKRPPAAVRALLERDERVLAWAGVLDAGPGAVAATNGFVVATNRGLWWPDVPARRMPWHLINKAVWSDGVLVITEADLAEDLLLVDKPAVSARLDEREPLGVYRRNVAPSPVDGEPAKVAKAVRQRVENSVAQTQILRLDDGAARIVARKVGGQDGWAWWARLEPGTPDTESVRRQLGELIERLRAEQTARQHDL